MSEIAVPDAGSQALLDAFRRRLGKVDRFPGFAGLQLLKDRRHPGRFLMVTHWESKEAFTRYMRSSEHRESHARIPTGPEGPRPAGFSDYDLVAE